MYIIPGVLTFNSIGYSLKQLIHTLQITTYFYRHNLPPKRGNNDMLIHYHKTYFSLPQTINI